MGIQAKALYDRNDLAGLDALARKIEAEALPRLTALCNLHSGLWGKYYKPFGWEIQDIRYGGMEKRLRAAAAKLKAYASGEIQAIPELAQPVCPPAAACPTANPIFPPATPTRPSVPFAACERGSSQTSRQCAM